MTATGVVIATSVAAAAAFATSSTLKHVSAGRIPHEARTTAGSVRRLVAATVRHPFWLAGIVADVVALSLQVTALRLGALAVVQPLLVCGLLFALVLRQLTRGRLRPAEIGWGVVLVASLAGFLTLSGTASANGPLESVDRIAALLVALTGLGLTAGCVLIGRRGGPAARSAALLGVATGTIYAATAALIKELTTLASAGPVAVLLSWQLATLIVLGATGLVLNQLAFQAGPLSASLPATSAVDPLASIVIGVVVYDEQIRPGFLAGAGSIALLAILSVAVIALARDGARDAATNVR
ncbi:MAG: DMT family transporter [Mycobacteriaceae bacterium]